MPERVGSLAAKPAIPDIEYSLADLPAPLPSEFLCAVTFGSTRHPDPRAVRVGLEPIRGTGTVELWHAANPVSVGFDGAIRYAADEHFLAGAIELDEREAGGLRGAAELAYESLWRFLPRSTHRHLVRVWNYFDAINHGSGDEERYKEFCAGRAAGCIRGASATQERYEDYPAATAIGRRDGNRTLQVYWLAARVPGRPIENPRQMSAYRYPRQYGPSPPRFSRAMLVADRLLLISGTASIVGHASHHPHDLEAQLRETLANLDSVLQRAASMAPGLQPRLGPHSLLKVYLRDRAGAPLVERLLAEQLPHDAAYLILEGDICREELLVEIDCIHGG